MVREDFPKFKLLKVYSGNSRMRGLLYINHAKGGFGKGIAFGRETLSDNYLYGQIPHNL